MPRKSSGIYWSDEETRYKVDKRKGGRRLRQSFGKDLGEAEGWLLEQLAKLNRTNIPGRVRHTFGDAASHYITLYEGKESLDQEIAWLKELLPHIGDLPLDRVYDATLKPFVDAQRKKKLKGGRRARPRRG